MNDVQKKLLYILQNVDLCCRELGINYFLEFGTLLGTVRHKGFIPWDDDVDIGMNRKNYDRFISEAPAWLEKHNLFLQEYHTEKTTPFSYAKVRLNGTKFVEYCNRNVKMHNGVYIDVFPFDYMASSEQEQQKYYRKIRFWELMFVYHQTPDITQKPNSLYLYAKFIARRLLHYAVQLLPSSFIYNKLRETEKLYSESEFCGLLNWPPSVILASDTEGDGLIELAFEGKKFYAPKSYDNYLTRLYGNYMELPPEKERHGHMPYIFSLGE